MTFVSRSKMRKLCANYIWNRSNSGFARIPRIVTDNPPRIRINPRLLLSRYRLLCLERLEHNVIHSSRESNQCQCGYMPHQIWPGATCDRVLNRTGFSSVLIGRLRQYARFYLYIPDIKFFWDGRSERAEDGEITRRQPYSD
jgi:hypothetical protein